MGPSEQLMPTALAPRPRAVTPKLSTVQPVKVRPPASKLMLARMGRLEFSRAASSAALSSYRSVKVSKKIRSAPAAAPARTMRAYSSTASSKARVPLGSSSSPSGPTSSAASAP